MLHLSVPTRLSIVAVALLTGLSACGADPAEPEDTAPPALDAGAAEDTGVSHTATKPVDAVPDAATKPVDTGTPTQAADPTLSALAGRYLLRFDSVGSATAAGFTIRSRVSLLVTAELAVDGTKLTAKERACNQTVLQKCTSGCVSATTVVDPKAIADFLVKRTFAREYTVAGAKFTAGRSVAAIGYDDDGAGAIPVSGTDSRVWDVVKGDPREGLLTQLTVSPPAPIPVISCKVYGAQKFVSQFAGALAGTGASTTFTAAEMTADLTDSDAKTLGSDVSLCATDSGSTATLEKATVRIARVGNALSAGETWACPSDADFDSKLPGAPL